MNETHIDVMAARALADEGLLTCRAHPNDATLLIWNYTAKTQYSRSWTPLTMACRGLITRPDGEIIARPFPKFFNLEEHVAAGREIPAEAFDVYEKLDGSLGILYQGPDGYAIATRGAFASPQAIVATRMLRDLSRDWPIERYTLLFEIIYPENRIVVNYGSRRDLVLLACIETATGREVPPEEIGYAPTARRYDGVSDVAAVRTVAEAGTEGAVIRFRESGLRLKVKLDEYVRLHRLLTGVTPRRVWEILFAGQSLDEFIADTPEEFSVWLRGVAGTLRAQYDAIDRQCTADFTREPVVGVDRKSLAERFKRCAHPAILFAMLDGKDHAPIIWEAIYPPAATAFRSQDEAVA